MSEFVYRKPKHSLEELAEMEKRSFLERGIFEPYVGMAVYYSGYGYGEVVSFEKHVFGHFMKCWYVSIRFDCGEISIEWTKACESGCLYKL